MTVLESIFRPQILKRKVASRWSRTTYQAITSIVQRYYFTSIEANR